MGPGRARLLALGGLIGPVAFVAAWVAAGAATAGYSSVDEAISRLAAVGAPYRVLMTLGFVCFGAALSAFAGILRRRLAGPAWVAATTTGVATLGVALVPLGMSPALDRVHNVLAAIGYVSLVAVPLLAAPQLARGGNRAAAAVSLVVAATAGACLGATALGPASGLAQRVGLALVDVWLMTSALVIVGTDPPPASGPRSGPELGE